MAATDFHPLFAHVQKKRAKRKRKPLLPKGYNSELPGGGLPPADPDRWLPKWQRADFRKKKARSQQRKDQTVKGSQVLGGSPYTRMLLFQLHQVQDEPELACEDNPCTA